MIYTVKDALEAWNAGETLEVFRVESEGTTQEKLWGEAFDLLEAEDYDKDGAVPEGLVFGDGLTEREKDVVRSIVAVVLKRGWAPVIRSHINAEHSPAISIVKA